MNSTICIAEDRELCEPSLKLLLLSLNVHCPEIQASLFYPPATDRFVSWLKKCPQVRLQTKRLKDGNGWNVKPQAIIQLLDEGFEEVIWIDSDIIVNRNVQIILSGLELDTLVVAENTIEKVCYDPNALRARMWELGVGRVFRLAVNSGVLRVTMRHHGLMARWWELVQSPQYQETQKRPYSERPAHMLGDQDVLTALLTSEEFSQVPIHTLRRGKDIIQFDGVYGYTVLERIRNLIGRTPVFVHSVAGKPWSEGWRTQSSTSLRDYIKMVYLDLSPYTLSAMRFRKDVDCDTNWMDAHYALSRFLRVLGMGRPELAGFPLAVFMEPGRIAKSLFRN